MSLRHRIEAYKDLWQRYCSTFSYFWKHRDQLETGMFREDEAAFLPAILSIQETPPSRTARIIARLLMLMVLSAFAWSIFGKMDIIVNAQGKIIPSERIKTIASVETGSVIALHVQEGQQVKEGDVLLQLDTRAIDAERDKALGERSQAVWVLARNQALLAAIEQRQMPSLPTLEALNQQYQITLEPHEWQAANLHIQAQYQDYITKSKKLADDIAYYSQTLPLATRQANSYRQLAATGDASRDAWQEKEQARLHIQAQLQEARNQLASLKAETTKTALDHIAEARRVAAASNQDAVRAASTSHLLTLKAPVDGTVQQLAVHTIGGVVPAAQPIMQIVPSAGPVEVEAMIENKDKGFVHAGQTVKVKVQAFEYTKYGTLPGKVIHVSQDAIPDEKNEKLNYAVKVLLDKTTLNIDGKDAPVIPGMAVTAEIKTGERRIIEYVLSPLLRYTQESLNER